MSGWRERYEALKAQAEELASTAQREVDARRATAAGSGETGASQNNLNARRKIMEMGRVITSMDKLAEENSCAPASPSKVTGYENQLPVRPSAAVSNSSINMTSHAVCTCAHIA